MISIHLREYGSDETIHVKQETVYQRKGTRGVGNDDPIFQRQLSYFFLFAALFACAGSALDVLEEDIVVSLWLSL